MGAEFSARTHDSGGCVGAGAARHAPPDPEGCIGAGYVGTGDIGWTSVVRQRCRSDDSWTLDERWLNVASWKNVASRMTAAAPTVPGAWASPGTSGRRVVGWAASSSLSPPSSSSPSPSSSSPSSAVRRTDGRGHDGPRGDVGRAARPGDIGAEGCDEVVALPAKGRSGESVHHVGRVV